VSVRPTRLRFDGWIAGLGTSTGVRVVIGCWQASPFGAFTDVMVERGDGHRMLLAPTREIADFVSATYRFDSAVVTPVTTARSRSEVDLRAGPLAMRLQTGARPPLGWLLRAVPTPLATTPRWIAAIDPVARLLLAGVRTTGTAGNGHREFYGAQDLRRIVAVQGRLDGVDLGQLGPVEPRVRFGFGSVPRRPAIVSVVTTVQVSE